MMSEIQKAQSEIQKLEPFYTPAQIMALLGIKRSFYYRLRKLGLLRYSRLCPGGPVIHTGEQVADYVAYLNGAGEIAVSNHFSKFRGRRTAAIGGQR